MGGSRGVEKLVRKSWLWENFQCIEVPVVQRIVSCCFSFLGGCQLDVDVDVVVIVLFASNCAVSYSDVRY